MTVYEVVFDNPDVDPERVTASGHKLIHDGRILSFHDDNGKEVFATDIHNVRFWRPDAAATAALQASSQAAAGLRALTEAGQPYTPPAPGAPRGGTIGEQVAADHGRRAAG